MPHFLADSHTLAIPDLRMRTLNDAPVVEDREYVLYWMVASRRTKWNYGLQRAIEWAQDLNKPLVVLEALRVGYRWASDRIHHFIIQGMADNARRFGELPVTYYPYLEPQAGAGQGFLEALAERACVVVSDDYPCFFLPRMQQVAARKIKVRFEVVDSNGLLPLRAAEKTFARAYDFRRFLQKNLPPHLLHFPLAMPFDGSNLKQIKGLPTSITSAWPASNVPPKDPSGIGLLGLGRTR